MIALEVINVLGPEHRDVITTGGAVIIAVVGAVSAVQVALIQSGRKAAKNAAQAAKTAVAQTVGNEADHTAVTAALAAQAQLLEDVQAELIRQRNDADARHRQAEARHRETRQDTLGIHAEIRLEREERHQLAEYVLANLPKKETP